MPFAPKIETVFYEKGKAAYDNGMSVRGLVEFMNRTGDEVRVKNRELENSHPDAREAPPGYVEEAAATFSIMIGFWEGVLNSMRRLNTLPKPAQKA